MRATAALAFTCAAISASAALAAPAPSGTPPPAVTGNPAVDRAGQGIVDVLLGKRPAAEVFAPAFLAAVPADKLAALKGQLEAQAGPLEGLQSIVSTGPGTGVVTIRFARATFAGPLTLDAEGKVAGLLLNDFQQLSDSAAAITADLAKLPGRVGVLYAPLDPAKPATLAVNADAQFAIGSTFKLYVLSALARQIAAGKHRWDEVVPLEDVRSLPSGMLQDWPKGAPVTLHTLATLMISISDNTATDRLIHLLGREALNAEVRRSDHSAPDRMLPFLTTREVFALKGDLASGDKYGRLDEAKQAFAADAMAMEIARDPAAAPVPSFTTPTLIDTVEWFASASDLRRQLAAIAAMDDPTARAIMAVAPAMSAPARKKWRYVGYKGGSEPGVLNLTWLLQKPDGAWWVLAMSWNDTAAPVDAAPLELIAQRILALP